MLRRVHEQILIQYDLAQFVDHDADARAAALPQKVAQQGRLAAPEKAGDDSERDRIMHVAGLPGSHRSADRSGVRKDRSEEHTSELQSLMRISYAVFCLKKQISTISITTKRLN